MTQAQPARDDPTAIELFRHEPPTTTRTRLIAAALELFYVQGIHAVGLDQVCAQVGISKQAFYRHFESKDALVEEAIRRRDEQEARALASMVRERAVTAKERLIALFDVLDLWFTHPDYRGCLFLSACNEFPNRNDPIHQAAAKHFASTAEWLTELSREAGAASPEVLATELLILAQGALSHRLVTGDDHAARAAGRVARTLVEAAVSYRRSFVPNTEAPRNAARRVNNGCK